MLRRTRFCAASYLDGGVYLATQTRPAGRFFAQLNVNLDEMNEEMDRYLREGIPDYVVVDWNRLPAEFDRYEEICALTSYDDSNRYIKSMILYAVVSMLFFIINIMQNCL